MDQKVSDGRTSHPWLSFLCCLISLVILIQHLSSSLVLPTLPGPLHVSNALASWLAMNPMHVHALSSPALPAPMCFPEVSEREYLRRFSKAEQQDTDAACQPLPRCARLASQEQQVGRREGEAGGEGPAAGGDAACAVAWVLTGLWGVLGVVFRMF